MRSLIRWEPFRPLSVSDAVNRLLEDSFVFPRGWLTPTNWDVEVPLDVYETGDEVVVKAALPGIKPEQVEISITGNTLTIRGESKDEKEVKRANYVRRERRFGSFERSVMLPTGLRTDKAEAEFEHGVLTLRVPKSEESKSKTVKVKVK